MKNKAFLVLACFLAFVITIPKLYKMCQIKGVVPGAIVSKEVITQKWNQTPEDNPKGRDVYWLSWTSKDIREIGYHRVNLEKEEWQKKKIGDEIELVSIKGDKKMYIRDGIFVSFSNFILDIFLLILEVGYIIYSLVNFRKSKKINPNKLSN